MNRLSAGFLTLLATLTVAAGNPTSAIEHVSTFGQPGLGEIAVPVQTAASDAAIAATALAEAGPLPEQSSSLVWLGGVLGLGALAAAFMVFSSRPKLRYRAPAAGIYAERQRIMALGQDGEAVSPQRTKPAQSSPVVVDAVAPVSTFDLYLARAALLAGKGGGPGIGRG